MAIFLATGEWTYSNPSNKNTAQTSVNNTVANYADAVAVASESYASGVNSPSNTSITVSYELPDRSRAESFLADITSAFSAGTRVAGLTCIARVRET